MEHNRNITTVAGMSRENERGRTMTHTRVTRKDYENYLNTFDCRDLNLSTEYTRVPGTWMRKNDPIQFNVGYHEYCPSTPHE